MAPILDDSGLTEDTRRETVWIDRDGTVLAIVPEPAAIIADSPSVYYLMRRAASSFAIARTVRRDAGIAVGRIVSGSPL